MVVLTSLYPSSGRSPQSAQREALESRRLEPLRDGSFLPGLFQDKNPWLVSAVAGYSAMNRSEVRESYRSANGHVKVDRRGHPQS